MNAVSHDCERTQRVISDALDDGRPLSDAEKRELMACDSCRRFHDAVAAMDEQLHVDAPAWNGNVALGDRRIRRPAKWTLWAGAAIGVAAAILLVASLRLGVGVDMAGPQPGGTEPAIVEMLDQSSQLTGYAESMYAAQAMGVLETASDVRQQYLDVVPAEFNPVLLLFEDPPTAPDPAATAPASS